MPAPASIAASLARAAECHGSGRLAEAEALCRKILQAQPSQFDALVLLGIVKAERGDRPEAIRLLRKATGRNPAAAVAHLNLGDVLHASGQPREALASYDAALAVAPNNADILANRANVLNRLGRCAEAIESCDRALAIAPRYAPAWLGRGIALMGLERHEEAVTAFTRALAANAAFREAWNNRGNALAALGRHQAAIADFDRALQGRPDYAEAWHNRANSLRALGDAEAALDGYHQALALRPAYAEALNGRGAALFDLNRHAEALTAIDRALAIQPDFTAAWIDRGHVLLGLGLHDEALASYLHAQAVSPDHAEAHVNEAMWRLLTGDFTAGWAKYEWRWRASGFRERNFARPLWLGKEDLSGKTILVHPEQGYGDTIQFCRYVPLLAARGAHVVLEVRPALTSLLSGLAGVSQLVTRGEKLPDFDFHCPLLSLPLAFGTTLETIPVSVPYLTAPPDRVRRWRDRLTVASPRIGLTWSGNPELPNDRKRSIALARLAPLFDVPANFVSLQKDLREPDRQWLAAHPGMVHFGEELTDFADTAALISLCDLVISVDTSVAHLAGALGGPAWIMVYGEWRWLLEREDSPWYPGARLFRRGGVGGWDSVIGTVAGELRSCFGAV